MKSSEAKVDISSKVEHIFDGEEYYYPSNEAGEK